MYVVDEDVVDVVFEDGGFAVCASIVSDTLARVLFELFRRNGRKPYYTVGK